MGDYVVQITVPDDHVVASTGVLLNPDQVLTDKQRKRLEKAKTTKKPMFIVTPKEAKKNESSEPSGTKTWIFKADQVRDFAWASSRKFIWDAMQHNMGDFPVMAMSFYPNEAEPLWSKYSTHSIIHTLEVYSRYTFDYPYPVAISVNGPVGGMEYPMICFNGPRPDSDGTYSASTKYGLISVVIHEVGHNYFPMIVNSDERQWTWMDEGLNTFLQFLAEQEWEDDYPSRRGEPRDIVGYMRSTNQVPIMTNSESILQFGPNAYSKPATALNILRETILGRELFDFAFKEYAIRWKFKRPMPADFFRTMEDASGVDLDWFWRGWFYSNDHVDLSITDVKQLSVRTRDPDATANEAREAKESAPISLSEQRNKDLERRTHRYPELKDFYNSYDPMEVSPRQREAFDRYFDRLSDQEKEIVKGAYSFYVVDLENVGGLVMPIILKAEFEDGSEKEFRYPAEIWRKNNLEVSKLVVTKKPIKSLTLDPNLETADVALDNNYFPRRILKSRFDVFRSGFRGGNVMRTDREQKEREKRRERAEKVRKEAAKQKKEAERLKKKADDIEAGEDVEEPSQQEKKESSAKTVEKKSKADAKKAKRKSGKKKESKSGKKSMSEIPAAEKVLKDEIKDSDT
jgi:aminopeptidase N